MTSGRRRLLEARTVLSASSDSSVRALNTRRVLRAVMVLPATQVQLARRTGLSQATVSGVVGRLQQEGVVEVDEGEGERGKRVRVAPMRGAAVGIEVGHDRLIVALRRIDNEEVLHQGGNRLVVGRDDRAWVGEAVRLIDDLLESTGMVAADVVSIGLGLPAAVDPRRGRVNQSVTAMKEDLRGNPATWFEEHYPGVPVVVDNEANFAAYGEYTYGVGRDAEVLLFVKASTGIGAGLVIGGTVFRGRHGFAGEVGHLTMDPNGLVCRCGNRGCLETLVSGPRLVEEVRQAYRGHRVDLPMTLAGLIERARAHDPVCVRVLQDAGRNIGLALARVCNIVNPDLVVLGGELGEAGDLVRKHAARDLERNVLTGMLEHEHPVVVRVSELGLLAGPRGALAFALSNEPTAQPSSF
ncbi:ROK family transcriptional regulator [Actinosynnema mirum]|uniref:ROK family protein n=1 Tax=Actinosynnema mirum (strain ATCC 29888 / DSM 43827 / JCM 3225 / NBRC 14064 / NCIMB 13271 / NRRL B-12336 / IMRU 3971 / 101) TaxID=446462 RepID=C6WP29_ACTMD|nr:ROK family transcriptional regulator [Actinosynnema mirum]ACU36698.1 ROK family protein [Actinosynnema mirum DSM 43827]